ncbi:hypothetical protein BDB00DRAFT_164685 [Zychaea mexicana]|uniref:uncharacterized protein n=1 Tax=Zychaea mexicana TaxID=64656 RepID=UPI0022FF1591|nr:uncharacterized protein BDB00DRAFT_164685 [Zychaea mexicana]KAI9496141.1 hypothetical protein BDB00DRAFT_164685 [Zychaea mexicana]
MQQQPLTRPHIDSAKPLYGMPPPPPSGQLQGVPQPRPVNPTAGPFSSTNQQSGSAMPPRTPMPTQQHQSGMRPFPPGVRPPSQPNMSYPGPLPSQNTNAGHPPQPPPVQAGTCISIFVQLCTRAVEAKLRDRTMSV